MEEGYAVGAFNAHNLESIIGICRAAEAMRSPAIIQFSEGAVKYIGLKNVYDLVKNSAEIVAPNAEIALHLDHGKSIGAVFECIEIGFSSVHIDASHMPLNQNINATKQVVEVARKKGVWVQGEVGAMVGGHGKVSDEEIEIPIAKVRRYLFIR